MLFSLSFKVYNNLAISFSVSFDQPACISRSSAWSAPFDFPLDMPILLRVIQQILLSFSIVLFVVRVFFIYLARSIAFHLLVVLSSTFLLYLLSETFMVTPLSLKHLCDRDPGTMARGWDTRDNFPSLIFSTRVGVEAGGAGLPTPPDFRRCWLWSTEQLFTFSYSHTNIFRHFNLAGTRLCRFFFSFFFCFFFFSTNFPLRAVNYCVLLYT